MENNNKLKIITLLIIVFCQSINGGGLAEDDVNKAEGMEVVQKRHHPIVETAMRLFSLPTAFPDTSPYWMKLDSLFQQGIAFFSPPNLDFRGSEAPKAGEEGTGKKVKEAVVKSVDKSKVTIEDSAKSAAEMAGEAVDKTTKKLKKTLPNKNQDLPEKAEL